MKLHTDPKREFGAIACAAVVFGTLIGLDLIWGSLLLPLEVLRIILGILFVLFIPGYLLQTAVFPRVGELDEYERIALSFGLSIAIIPPLALILDVLPWGIQLESILVALGLLTLTLSLASWYRRSRVPEDEQFRIAIEIDVGAWWAEQDRVSRWLYSILMLAFTVGILTALTIALIPGPATRFTEFYILGEEGLAESYPQKIKAGEHAVVTAGVTNQEGESATYHIEVINDDRLIGQVESFRLEDNETIEVPVEFAPMLVGEDSRIEFILYRDNSPIPYRSLRLWVKVSEP